MPFPNLSAWRNRKQLYGLAGEVCPHCDHKIFPPRDVCPNCGDEAEEKFNQNLQNNVFETREKVDVLEKV
ncbi:MAG: zinc ribbon domain-containing protein [Candidatus Shapirobacteria bacterium]